MNAPFGVTKTGRIRKKPLKAQAAAQPAPTHAPVIPQPPSAPPKPSAICPVCRKSFNHRPHPNTALWQHLLYNKQFDEDHLLAHQAKKAAILSASGSSKKERDCAKAAKWRSNNKEKSKKASVLGGLKSKALRHLNKAGKLGTKEAINELVAKWEEEAQAEGEREG